MLKLAEFKLQPLILLPRSWANLDKTSCLLHDDIVLLTPDGRRFEGRGAAIARLNKGMVQANNRLQRIEKLTTIIGMPKLTLSVLFCSPYQRQLIRFAKI